MNKVVDLNEYKAKKQKTPTVDDIKDSFSRIRQLLNGIKNNSLSSEPVLVKTLSSFWTYGNKIKYREGEKLHLFKPSEGQIDLARKSAISSDVKIILIYV